MNYQIGRLEVDCARRVILAAGVPCPAQPKVFQLIELLLRRHPAVVTYDEILRVLWPGVTVTAGSIRQVTRMARRVLAGSGLGPDVIQTSRTIGLRLHAEVRRVATAPPTAATPQEVTVIFAQAPELTSTANLTSLVEMIREVYPDARLTLGSRVLPSAAGPADAAGPAAGSSAHPTPHPAVPASDAG